MHENERPSGSGTIGSAEAPDRAAPHLQTIAGEPIAFDAPVPRVERRLEREAVREHMLDELRAADAPAPAEAPKADAAAEERHRTQLQLRRIDELAAEHEHVSRWSGAEHTGTVVAVAIDGVIVHVGRNEHIQVPAQGGAANADLVGKLISVDRSGALSEVSSHEMAPRALDTRETDSRRR